MVARSKADMEQIQHRVKLHRAQHTFRHSEALYRAFVGGRGAGKSWVGAYDLIRRKKPGRTYMIGSPTATILGDTTLPTFEAIAKELGVWRGCKLTPYPNVKLSENVTVRFRSFEDPEKARGPNLSGIWLDEASLMAEEAYTIAIASLREAGEQGWLSATFTPKGPHHWTYNVFGKGKPNTYLVRARTGQNPFNPPNFEQTLAEQYTPEFARQELGGEFIEMTGAEFPGAWFPESLWFHEWPPDCITLRVIALDPSKGRTTTTSKAKLEKGGDYSAFVLLARDRNGTLWVEADLARRPTAQIVRDGLILAKRFELETYGTLDGLGCESDQFQELLADQFLDLSRKLGIQLPLYKMLTGGIPKEVRIRRLTPYLAHGQIRFRDTPGTRLLVQQLQSFPIADHDDGPDALEYAIRLAIRLWNGKQSTKPRG